MKELSIINYNPTEDEIQRLFGEEDLDAREAYESFLRICEKYDEDGDSHRRMIALLLMERDDVEGAYKMAESIKDVGFRRGTLEWLGFLEADKTVEPGVIWGN